MKYLLAIALLVWAAPAAAQIPSPLPAPGAGPYPAPLQLGSPGMTFSPLGAVPPPPSDGTVISSRHNLSVTGSGAVRAQSETEVCKFCHVAHGGGPRGDNRPPTLTAYQPYNSTTLSSRPGAPTGASRICLSCHDGTVALGQTVASGTIALSVGPAGKMPAGGSNFGTDLTRGHPVSFRPNPSAPLHAPPMGDPVRLDAAGRLECTSCHDPHRDDLDPAQRKFLVKSNRASALCLSCHAIPSWTSNPSAHQSSNTLFDAALGATSGYTTVADNGCESCHRPHDAATSSRLLSADGGALCLKCHNGRAARFDLSSDLGKPYAHPILGADPTLHDAAEGPTSLVRPLPETRSTAPRHAQCVDCHDPHAAFSQAAAAPRASGALAGVWGIDRNGFRVEPVQLQYEVCFKCHADSANQPQARGPTPPETVRRAVTDINLRRVFDLGAPSFHPVEGPGRGTDVPSLIPPYNTSSVISCGDCHASDSSIGAGGQGPRGPHGSTYAHILERNLNTADRIPESPFAYALCYKCHDRNVLLSNRSSFNLHNKHVAGENTPCTACHDGHGVSAVQGDPVHNAHLVNFDISIVKPSATGLLQYTSEGYRRGSCSLNCHGQEHQRYSY